MTTQSETRAPQLINLLVALDQLRCERDLKEEAAATVESLNAAFAADHEPELLALALAKGTVASLEARIRVEIEAEYRRQGMTSKTVAPGASVTESTTSAITDKAAVEAWCRGKGMFLAIDESAFKRFAEGERKAGRELPPGVTVTTAPKAAIATKLPVQDIPEDAQREAAIDAIADDVMKDACPGSGHRVTGPEITRQGEGATARCPECHQTVEVYETGAGHHWRAMRKWHLALQPTLEPQDQGGGVRITRAEPIVTRETRDPTLERQQ